MTRPSGLTGRLLAAGLLLVALMIGSGYMSALGFTRVSETMSDSLQESRESAVLLFALTSALEDEDDALLLALAGDPARAQSELAAERARFDDAHHRLDLLLKDAEERSLLGAVADADRAYRAKGDALMQAAPSARARDLYLAECAPILRQANIDAGRLREHRFRETRAVAARAGEVARNALFLVSAVSVASLALLVLIAWRIARDVLAPLRELTSSVEAVRAGDFARRVTPRRDDELGQLGRGFNRMAASLAEFHASQLGEVLSANQILEATLEALPEAVLVLGPSGAIERTNARARSLFTAVLGRLPRTIEEVPLPPAAAAAIGDVARGSPPPNPTRTDLGRALTFVVDGEERLFLPRAVEATVRERRRVVVVLDEITDVARLDDMRTEFIAAASHELRTPLTTIQMTLALLQETSGLDERQRTTLSTARIGCEQLSTTLNAFLDVTRIQTGRLVLFPEALDVAALVGQVTTSMRPRFEERGMTLSVEAARDATVRGDRVRLVAVVSNLLSNALKYAPAGSEVRVRVTHRAGLVTVTVDDEGVGVPLAFRDRIFEKYFRVEQVEPRGESGPRGAGIGLYLCRRIVEAHAGQVRCETPPGMSGARFVVEVPGLHAHAHEACR